MSPYDVPKEYQLPPSSPSRAKQQNSADITVQPDKVLLFVENKKDCFARLAIYNGGNKKCKYVVKTSTRGFYRVSEPTGEILPR